MLAARGAARIPTAIGYTGRVEKLAVLLALTGCDMAFGLHAPPIDAAPDAPDAPIDAAPDAACTQKVTRPVIADGQIYATDPTLPGNDVTAMNLQYTAGLHTVGLFKFDVTAQGLPDAIELELANAIHDPACGTSCASTCAHLEAPGDLQVFVMTSNWDEGSGLNRGATWNCRRGDTSGCVVADQWYAPGATDPRDRGAQVATFTSSPGMSASIPIDLAAWAGVESNKLSFQVVAGFNGAKMLVRAKESTCDVGTPAAQLVLTYCP